MKYISKEDKQLQEPKKHKAQKKTKDYKNRKRTCRKNEKYSTFS
jgi:hypothetical protein